MGQYSENRGRRALSLLADGAVFLIGSVLYAVAVDCFITPNSVVLGGLTGIATVVSRFTGFPVGAAVLIMNVPLFIMAVRAFGFEFLGKTIVGTVLVSVMIDLLYPFLPTFKGDVMLAVLYGGILAGAALGLIFLRGGTTGGTDIIASVIHRRFKRFSIGRIVLFCDALIITAAAVVYRDVTTALYSVVTVFVCSRTMDTVLYGNSRGQLVLCVTARGVEVADRVMNEMERGATLVGARGAYTNRASQLVIFAVRVQEAQRLQRIIAETDPAAFVIVTNADGIVGEGFESGG